jgi:small subunit ribosomal protein S21
VGIAVIADIARDRRDRKNKNLPRRRGDTENSQGQKIGTPGESKGSQYFQPRRLSESPIWRGVMYPLKSTNYEIQLRAPLKLARRNSLAEVRLQEGEPLENALRRFKRKVQTEDIIKEVKRHSYYLKPGEKKRVKQALARKRAKKKIRKDRDSRPDRD